MSHKAFQKEREKYKNEIIRKLRAEILTLEKKVKHLENELKNVVKPIRREPILEEKKPDKNQWKKEFVKAFKERIKNTNE